MLPVHASVALRAPCFVVSAGSLGRLSQALRDATELPLRKPTAVFCGHGPTMHTGMDHTFSRKWVSGAHDSLCLLFREVAYCVWLRHKNRWLTWWHKHVVSVHSPEVITCWALCGISTPWENQKHNWEKKKRCWDAVVLQVFLWVGQLPPSRLCFPEMRGLCWAGR